MRGAPRLEALAVQRELTGIGAVHAEDQVTKRALACSVLTQQAVDLPRLEFQVHVVERERIAKALAQAPRLQERVRPGSRTIREDRGGADECCASHAGSRSELCR